MRTLCFPKQWKFYYLVINTPFFLLCKYALGTSEMFKTMIEKKILVELAWQDELCR